MSTPTVRSRLIVVGIIFGVSTLAVVACVSISMIGVPEDVQMRRVLAATMLFALLTLLGAGYAGGIMLWPSFVRARLDRLESEELVRNLQPICAETIGQTASRPEVRAKLKEHSTLDEVVRHLQASVSEGDVHNAIDKYNEPVPT